MRKQTTAEYCQSLGLHPSDRFRLITVDEWNNRYADPDGPGAIKVLLGLFGNDGERLEQRLGYQLGFEIQRYVQRDRDDLERRFLETFPNGMNVLEGPDVIVTMVVDRDPSRPIYLLYDEPFDWAFIPVNGVVACNSASEDVKAPQYIAIHTRDAIAKLNEYVGGANEITV